MSVEELKYLKELLDERHEIQDSRHKDNQRELVAIREKMVCEVHDERIKSISTGMTWMWGILTVMIAAVVIGYFK